MRCTWVRMAFPLIRALAAWWRHAECPRLVVAAQQVNRATPSIGVDVGLQPMHRGDQRARGSRRPLSRIIARSADDLLPPIDRSRALWSGRAAAATIGPRDEARQDTGGRGDHAGGMRMLVSNILMGDRMLILISYGLSSRFQLSFDSSSR